MTSRALAVAATLAAACAAGAPGGEGAERRVAPVVNGIADLGDPGVVALTAYGGQAYCTGTLVSPRVVLTAAHCFEESLGAPPLDQVSIFFGFDVNAEGVFIPAASFRQHPGWVNGGSFANDIAVLAMSDPSSVAPVAMNAVALGPAFLDAPARIAGFGVTSAAGTGGGQKLTGLTAVAGVAPTSFDTKSNPAQTCYGDSGGPVFLTIDGVERVAGVTSSGDENCLESGTNTRVDAYLEDFVLPFIAEIEGAAGCLADGECVLSCSPPDPDCGPACEDDCPGLPLGELCTEGIECASGLCVGAMDDPSITFCSAWCQPGARDPCGAGALSGEPMVCVPATPGDRAACVYPSPSPGAVGWECGADTGQCRSGLCLDGLCSRLCAAEGSADCPLGFECGLRSTTGERVCLPAGPGTGWCSLAADRRPFAGLLPLAGLLLLAGIALRRRP